MNDIGGDVCWLLYLITAADFRWESTLWKWFDGPRPECGQTGAGEKKDGENEGNKKGERSLVTFTNWSHDQSSRGLVDEGSGGRVKQGVDGQMLFIKITLFFFTIPSLCLTLSCFPSLCSSSANLWLIWASGGAAHWGKWDPVKAERCWESPEQREREKKRKRDGRQSLPFTVILALTSVEAARN